MGRMKEQAMIAEEKKCKRRKFKDKQSALNSTFAVSRNTHKSMEEPVFCNKCNAWHLGFKERAIWRRVN